MHGRLYTWSNERRRPTLEQIDRAFATIPWLDTFPDHRLRALSLDCSDHAPVLLEQRTEHRASPRFRFEPFWARMDGFLETVQHAWSDGPTDVDACCFLDIKLRRTANALKSWSMRQIGSARQQLFMSRKLIAQFDKAQEIRELDEGERELRSRLKKLCLGLASLSRTIARHRSRIRFLGEGMPVPGFFTFRPVIARGRITSLLCSTREFSSLLRKQSRTWCMTTTTPF